MQYLIIGGNFIQGEENLKLLKDKRLLIGMFIFIFIIIFLIIFKDKLLKMVYPKTYNEIVSIYAEKYEVDNNLIFAVIKAESNFNSQAVSNKSAIGVMQIVEETAIDVAKKNGINLDGENVEQELLKVDNNINIGTKYLSTLINKYKNIEVSLAAYNAGIGTVDNWIEKGIIKSDGSDIENIQYKETNNYVRKILRDYKIYNYLYEKS